MRYFIVDAFADTKFGGNPAGVVLIPDGEDFPAEEIMTKTAGELRYSETAFVKRLSRNQFNVRYFTPSDEVDLCGHATIGTFSALVQRGIIEKGEVYLNKTLAGDIEIQVQDDMVLMDMAAPQFIGEIDEKEKIDELYEVMGSNIRSGKLKTLKLLNPTMISTGLPDIMLQVESLESLNSLAPDMDKLSRLSDYYKVTGVHAFALTEGKEGGYIAHCRNFAPLVSIPEEAATGTSNGALTYHLFRNGIIKSGEKSDFLQGEAMGRPSVITSFISDIDGNCSIKIGGRGVILAEGEFHI